MGRIVQLIFILFLASDVGAEKKILYKGLPLGGYVGESTIKKFDLKNTVSQGYLCYRSKGKLVQMLFDPSDRQSRFTAVSLFKGEDVRPELVCIDSEEIEPVFSADIGRGDKESVSQRLLSSGFSSLPTRIPNHYLFSKLIDSGKKCFDVNDKFEGSYSFLAEFSRELKVDVAYDGNSVLSMTKSIVESKAPLETFASLGCER